MGHNWFSTFLPCLFVSLLATRSHGEVTCPSACTCSPQSMQCIRNQDTGKGIPRVAHNQDIMGAIPKDVPNSYSLTSLTIINMRIERVTGSDLSQFPHLKRLDLTQNRIQELDNEAFRNLTVLESLVIRRNFLRRLSDETFVGLVRLKVLDMSQNQLVELNYQWFLPLKNLEVLDLSGNEIEHIQHGAFTGLYRLHTLNLAGNRLISLNEFDFQSLNSLETLLLNNNSLLLVESNSFSSLTRLKRLTLADNKKLTFLQAKAFRPKSGPSLLEDLSLSGTSVTKVSEKVQKTLTRLKTLDMSRTPIIVIRSLSFSYLENLINLTLDSLPGLSRVEKDAFFGLKSLNYLTITNNRRLNNISEGVFANLSSLSYLDLHSNGMETFQRGLADWQNLQVVDLRDNPLHCDCNVAWMLTSLYNASEMTSSENVIQLSTKRLCRNISTISINDKTNLNTAKLTQQISCRSPSQFAGRCLVSLTAEELQCSGSERTYSTSHSLQASVTVVAIFCALFLLCGLVFRFRRRVCRVCNGQYLYQEHRNQADSRHSSLADVLEMETTQLEECTDSDLES